MAANWHRVGMAAALAVIGVATAATAFSNGLGAGVWRDAAVARQRPMTNEHGITPWWRDIAYGAHPKQRLDVYRPRNPHAAPVIVMVHGGAWRTGDKAARSVVSNKAARWVPKGFILVSVNYRLLPEADAYAQADDVARAIAHVQAHARTWGGDPARVIVMGHSAGAHLVALLGAAPRKAHDARPWLGTVALDSAVLDVPAVLGRPRAPGFYAQAFGTDPARWKQGSPVHVLQRGATPLLAVCSLQRRDGSCRQADAYVERAKALGVMARALPQNLSHGQINHLLGTPGPLTDGVEAFMAALDPQVAARLKAP